MAKKLEGMVALVTGCGSSGPGWGNGKAISTLFAREGAKIFGCDINVEAARETQDIIEKEGGQCVVRAVDVANPTQVEALVEECNTRYGRIDVLVNNVGIAELGGPVECPHEKWQRGFDVNVTSMFLTCKHVLPIMERLGGGSIVNIGSIAGIRYSGVNYISYYTTKAAILGFSRGVALHYAKQHIRSNVLMPGLMNTPIFRPLTGAYGQQTLEELIAKRDQQCPMGHMGDAWDVAEAALYLASDAAKYVTGTELIVDGGLSAKFT